MTASRSVGLFAAISMAIILSAWVILRLVFATEQQHQALIISAVLAFAVQVGAFSLVAPGRAAGGQPGELIVRWGMGAVIRLVVLVLFAVLAKVMQLPLDAALVGLATYFFLTMMAEPLLLNHVR